jgi:ATP-dependent DNA helicase DinG
VSTVKEEINEVYEALAKANPHFKSRPSQRVMVAEVAKLFWGACTAMENEVVPKVIAIEAPTGSGKGLGYLIPGITVARRQKKKLIVSTATVKLQGQLINSDLPTLQQAFPGGMTYAIAKGRRRYVCPLRLEREAGAAGQMDMMDDAPESKSKQNDQVIIQLHRDYNQQRWNGERDSVKVEDEVWRDISTDRTGCTTSKCAHYKNCPFFKARAQLDTVDVIVANHDLVLSDLAMGGGVVLPQPDQSLYAIDEAHHLPDKCREAFAGSFQVGTAMHAMERIAGEIYRSLPNKELAPNLRKNAEAVHDALEDLLGAMWSLDSLNNPGDQLRFPYGQIDGALTTLITNFMSPAQALSEEMGKIGEWCKEEAEREMSKANAEKLILDVAVQSEVLGQLLNAGGWLLMSPEEKDVPIAKWIDVVPAGRSSDLRLSASSVSAAKALANMFYERATAVVLTSATLSALNNFEAFREESGLRLMGNQAKCFALPSPFDYANQGAIVVPKMETDPKNAEAHTAEVARMIPMLYPESGGALVLFPSWRQLNAVVAELPATLRAKTLIQGEHAPDEIIEMHKQAVDRDGSSVIFGLQTMAEGVDLPREYCVRVVITKLPFDVPSDPISATHSEWLESQGRNPFAEMSLPSLSRKLNQWVGRLIRTEQDWGDIVLLDSRLISKSYGKRILGSLPAFKQVLNQPLVALRKAA